VTTIGALALARLFASLARRMPADGGPYAYARVAFGNKLGFANAWSYWITAWAGNAAIAVGWVLYVEVFINKGQAKLWSILLVLVGLWIPAFINLTGLKNMGWFQVATTITKFAALAFMSIVGLFYINTANYSPFNVSGHSAISAVGSGMAIALFSSTWGWRRRPWRRRTSAIQIATSRARRCSALSPLRLSICCRCSRSSGSSPTTASRSPPRRSRRR
jgi:basic amino acid/polyamine antiporter, APA family